MDKGQTIARVCEPAGITDQTYYRWRWEYCGLKTNQVRRFMEFECENARQK